METLDITFLRHGRSAADDEDVIEGRYDSPLTEIGRSQALARGEAWKAQGITYDLVICSTLKRARSTAEIVAEVLGAQLLPDPNWMEMDNGLIAGMAVEEAEKRYPSPAFYSPYWRMGKTGENDIELHARAARAVASVVERGPGRYLVVSHGRILNAALRSILNIPMPVNGSGVSFAFQDLGFARLTYKPDLHRWTLWEFSG